jgi:diaminohydroxyphosphoribosylaminopyrimidine deaminase / 5-amino-6-(5-phosphoribosylamino)uracil reductase
MSHQIKPRPSVTLKLATSLDGKIATASGQSKWITGEEARRHVHRMRAAHDCVLTGIGTVVADDPELTARLDEPVLRQPLRAVLDTHARTPAEGKLAQSRQVGAVCLFHGPKAHFAADGFVRRQVAIDARGQLNLHAVLDCLMQEFAVKTIMVEAGPKVAGAFLRAGLVDEIAWFRAPIILGGDGLSVFDALNVDVLSHAIACDRVDSRVSGHDMLERYKVRAQ